jgi:hypothetical protein
LPVSIGYRIERNPDTPVATLRLLLTLCGAGHVVLGVASLAMPRALNWKLHLKTLPLLLRQMFWTMRVTYS